MTALPYSPLPLTHPARAYVPADHTDVAATLAEFQEQHAPILVCPIDGDDDE